MSKYKQEILSYIMQHENEYVSGQKLAEQFNISRTAVWKAIEALKVQGFIFESIKNKGYRITKYPTHWDSDFLSYILKDSLFKTQYVYQEVASTQIIAHEKLLEHNNPFLVLSEIQTAGRGRFKRPWVSKPDKGLWMSLVLHPNISYQQIATFNLFMSIAIAETIKRLTSLDPKIKWPNDIYINDKKVCGFLTEINGDSDGVHTIICGIGININHEYDEFDDCLREIATSLKIESGKETNRYQLIKTLIDEITKYYDAFLTQPFSNIKAVYISYSMIWDRTLRYTEGEKQIYGKAVDLKDDGVLVVVDITGQLHQFISADIEV
ncbi:biotin--[acetyl-CoA-carboxylase] ligase [Macrococcoides caseolyticum]|uniref:biotin--[acetyl-CoA-carboxylase] ligase n=1 Tax=Macrococcoides caseolyticum TaxID=69966 RepID=UPI001F1E5CC2|nr:biotin--[acetyl-CoA-carboxylase] ligase [Macrococcus caseolyticus]MCE4957053.1 biotin--[acetyl-CoA-carboxylase] ligase [Macrococcus caseolyticus]